MDINTVRIIFMLLSFAFFIGVCFWAYAKQSKSALDEAAQLPFED